MDKLVIGFIVNPIAGMGGSVGLKGTDGEMYQRAVELGAEPTAPQRAEDMLSHIKNRDKITLLVAPGPMGQDYVEKLDIPFTVAGEIGKQTTPADTRRISREMCDAGAALLAFVGGDGTARDVHDAIGTRVPVIAVPAGVKVYSSVFAFSTQAAAEMIDIYVNGDEAIKLTEEEVLDIDEEAYRQNRLSSRLYGYLMVPNISRLVQPGKIPSPANPSSDDVKADMVAYLMETLDPEYLYLLGPGTTIKALADEMEIPKTLLGIDALMDGKLVDADLNEKGLSELLKTYPKRKIIVTPIGGNGFIFGRGNKQFTPKIIRQVGRENIMVAATPDKINGLSCLRVDTGDSELDQELSGYMEVITGYREVKMMKVTH